ncbi:MAG: DUF3302 domain-containing protein [Rhizobiaceae bacterium]
MDELNIFALVILLVLAIAVVSIWIVLAIMPGRIARDRHHPQADAIMLRMDAWINYLMAN